MTLAKCRLLCRIQTPSTSWSTMRPCTATRIRRRACQDIMEERPTLDRNVCNRAHLVLTFSSQQKRTSCSSTLPLARSVPPWLSSVSSASMRAGETTRWSMPQEVSPFCPSLRCQLQLKLSLFSRVPQECMAHKALTSSRRLGSERRCSHSNFSSLDHLKR